MFEKSIALTLVIRQSIIIIAKCDYDWFLKINRTVVENILGQGQWSQMLHTNGQKKYNLSHVGRVLMMEYQRPSSIGKVFFPMGEVA